MAKQTQSPRTWQARARQLAVERDMVGRARRIGSNDLGGELYKVASGSHDGTVSYHVQVFWPAIDAYSCDCMAGCYGKPCSHVGSVIFERERVAREEMRRRSPARLKVRVGSTSDVQTYREMLDDYPCYPA